MIIISVVLVEHVWPSVLAAPDPELVAQRDQLEGCAEEKKKKKTKKENSKKEKLTKKARKNAAKKRQKNNKRKMQHESAEQ